MRQTATDSAPTIRLCDLSQGMLHDLADDRYPTQVRGWDGEALDLPEGATHYGHVHRGDACVTGDGYAYTVAAGCYFALPGAARLAGAGSGIVVSRLGHRGMFQIGGPIELEGRLRYIDGCSDTVLVHPPVLGDPCLNYLYFPPGIDQTQHTHPSLRAGLIVAGEGACRTDRGTLPLRTGDVFVLQADAVHGFMTSDSDMRIVVYHPDSDCGPSHDSHPMLNRTIVDGISAAQLDAIRTRSTDQT